MPARPAKATAPTTPHRRVPNHLHAVGNGPRSETRHRDSSSDPSVARCGFCLVLGPAYVAGAPRSGHAPLVAALADPARPPLQPSPVPSSLALLRGFRRPSSYLGRPLRVRGSVLGVASARCVGLVGEGQGQLRLRRAGSESRGAALYGWGCRCWSVGSGRVLPSPVPGGNQGSAGSATGGGLAGCCLLSSPVALPAEPLVGLRRPGEGSTRPRLEECALRFGSGPCSPLRIVSQRVMLRAE